MALHGALHKMPRHVENLLMKYGPDRAVKAEDHLDPFYLHVQTLNVCYKDVECRLFPCTLNGRAVVWYHSLHVNSIQNWGMFKRIFLEKFVDDKTPAMLLKQLGSLNMEPKEKVKDFNQSFNCIMNKFTINTKPHNSITIDYYTSSLPTSIVQFMKQAMKPTLSKNCKEEIDVEKELHAIGGIVDNELAKDSKDVGRRSQDAMTKVK